MASLEYLKECMERDLEIMNDPSRPSEVRRAASARFWHCEKRVGTMERGGLTHDNPGHHLIGYSELGYGPENKGKKTAPIPPSRRDIQDEKTAAHFAAQERL